MRAFFSSLASVLLLFNSLRAAAHPSPHQHSKRQMTFINFADPDAQSSICSESQMQTVNNWAYEASSLADAGLRALQNPIEMFQDYNRWFDTRQDMQQNDRILGTFKAFFGLPHELDDAARRWYLAKTQKIYRILSNIANSQPETLPETISIACDSTYFLKKDPEGHTTKPGGAPLGPDDEYRYDIADPVNPVWRALTKNLICEYRGVARLANTAIFTSVFPVNDRVTICPELFELSSNNRPSLSQSAASIVADQTRLSDFKAKGVTTFFHELLHTHSLSGLHPADPEWLNDIREEHSYGPETSSQIARENPNEAFSNVENVVWFCISMYFDQYKWKDLTARTLDHKYFPGR